MRWWKTRPFVYISFVVSSFYFYWRQSYFYNISVFRESYVGIYNGSNGLNSKISSVPLKYFFETSFTDLCLSKGNSLVLLPSDSLVRTTDLVDAGSEPSLWTCLLMGRNWIKSVHRNCQWVFKEFTKQCREQILFNTVNALCYLQYCPFK